MTKRGFLSGIIAGGIMGTMFGVMMSGRSAPKTRSRVLKAGEMVGRKAGKFIAAAGARVGSAVEKRIRH